MRCILAAMNYAPPPNMQRYYEQVWAIVRQIPQGRVATYGQIAKLLPAPQGIDLDDYRQSPARTVGLAMAACPDDVPWQRVVNSQGKISHKAEPGKQKQLLEAEGVLFAGEKLNLIEYEWLEPGHKAGPKQGQLF